MKVSPIMLLKTNVEKMPDFSLANMLVKILYIHRYCHYVDEKKCSYEGMGSEFRTMGNPRPGPRAPLHDTPGGEAVPATCLPRSTRVPSKFEGAKTRRTFPHPSGHSPLKGGCDLAFFLSPKLRIQHDNGLLRDP